MAEPQQSVTFEQIVTRIESIAAKMEAGDVQLEQALTLFEEGMKLSKAGSQRLDDAERRLEVLLANGDTEPLHNAAGGLKESTPR